MSTLVTYRTEDGIATITMDDGKRNALSAQMFAELNAAFDRALASRCPSS
jgi:enoyl-CoA hydratase